MLRGSRGPDPLTNKKVFAGSDYLTASASRRYFNLGGIIVQEKWTKLLKPWKTYHGTIFGIGSSYGRPIYSPCLKHAYTLQYLFINIKCFFNVRLSQGQSPKILFGINKHVHRRKQYIWKAWSAWTQLEKHSKYLHNGIMHTIGTQLIYYCCEFLFLKAW